MEADHGVSVGNTSQSNTLESAHSEENDSVNGNVPAGQPTAPYREKRTDSDSEPSEYSVSDEEDLDSAGTPSRHYENGEGMDLSPEDAVRSNRSVEALPEEVLEYLLTFVSPYEDLQHCQRVNRRWYQAVKRVRADLRRLLHRSVASLKLSWYHYTERDHSEVSRAGGPVDCPIISSRCAHSAAMIDGLLYVFGGCSSRLTCFNDIWRLDPGALVWERPPAIRGTFPTPKAYGSMVAFRHRLFLYGGWSQATPYALHHSWRLYDNMHVFDTHENRWEELRGTGTEPADARPGRCAPPSWPPPLSRHGASVHGTQMVVMGGLCSHRNTGRFSPSGDVWVFDLVGEQWRLQACTTPAPGPRYGHTQLALDDAHLLLLGGSSGPNQLQQDVWLLEVGTRDTVWTWKRLQVDGLEHRPMHVWCHPACQVGDQAVVLTCSPVDTPLPPEPPPPPPARGAEARPPPPPPPHREQDPMQPPPYLPLPGGFGLQLPRHSTVARPSFGLQPRSSDPRRPERGQLARRLPRPAAGRALPSRPSVRRNARDIMELRLAGLQRASDRLEWARAERAAPHPRPRNRAVVSRAYSLTPTSGRRRMMLHVLDARAALRDGIVRWNSRQVAAAPGERILYSLTAVPEAGEIIMFGGIAMPPPGTHDFGLQPEDLAHNSVTLLSVPNCMFR